MKKILLFLMISFTLVACGQQSANNVSLEKQEGIVALKKERAEKNNQILLIPNIKEEDLKNKTESIIIKIAQDNDGAFYSVSDEEYNRIEVGTNVIIHWNGNQNDSDPPQRGAQKIEEVSN